MDSNLSKCEQLESYLFALYRQINDCYLEMPHVINGGRYWVSLQMKLCELEKELGSMVYIKEHWIEYHKYEEKLRMQVALGRLMWSTSAFYEYYETHNEELDSAFSQKDLIEQYMEAKDSVYGGYQASFGEVITPGYYKRIAAKLKELYGFFEDYYEEVFKPKTVEKQPVAEDQPVKQEPALLSPGEYFSAEFLRDLYDALKEDLFDEYSVFTWTCIWNLVNVDGPVRFKRQRGPRGAGSAQLYYLIHMLTEYLRSDKRLGDTASQWETSIVHMMGLSWQTYESGRRRCANQNEQAIKPAYADFAETIEEFFKTHAGYSI